MTPEPPPTEKVVARIVMPIDVRDIAIMCKPLGRRYPGLLFRGGEPLDGNAVAELFTRSDVDSDPPDDRPYLDAIEEIRVASFEAPPGRSASEWERRIRRILERFAEEV